MTLRLTARCVRGLEWLVAAEVAGAADGGADGGAREITFAQRQVSFTTRRLDARWLGLRTADDVLLDLGTLHGIDHTRAAPAELSRQLNRIDFAAGLDVVRRVRSAAGAQGARTQGTDAQHPEKPQVGGAQCGQASRPVFDVVASLLGRRNYNRFAVEDAAGAVVAKALGARYVSRDPASATGHGRVGDTARSAPPDFTVRLSLSGDAVDVALRLSPRPLHRRPWKLDTGPGTLHPPLAAALALIGAGGNRVGAAFDPFCGDGTLAIETALAASDATILAGDLDAERLRNAGANAARAGVLPRVRFVRADAGRAAWADGGFDLLVTNPPWNRAVGAAGTLADTDTLDPFWRSVPAALTPHGRICTVAETDLDVPSALRRAGYMVTLAQAIRLAGRVSHVILAAPPHAADARLPAALEDWRERAIKAGIVSDGGF